LQQECELAEHRRDNDMEKARIEAAIQGEKIKRVEKRRGAVCAGSLPGRAERGDEQVQAGARARQGSAAHPVAGGTPLKFVLMELLDILRNRMKALEES
jgi:hypothetical protein